MNKEIRTEYLFIVEVPASTKSLLEAQRELLNPDKGSFQLVFWGYTTGKGFCLDPGRQINTLPNKILKTITLAVVPTERGKSGNDPIEFGNKLLEKLT